MTDTKSLREELLDWELDDLRNAVVELHEAAEALGCDPSEVAQTARKATAGLYIEHGELDGHARAQASESTGTDEAERCIVRLTSEGRLHLQAQFMPGRIDPIFTAPIVCHVGQFTEPNGLRLRAVLPPFDHEEKVGFEIFIPTSEADTARTELERLRTAACELVLPRLKLAADMHGAFGAEWTTNVINEAAKFLREALEHKAKEKDGS